MVWNTFKSLRTSSYCLFFLLLFLWVFADDDDDNGNQIEAGDEVIKEKIEQDPKDMKISKPYDMYVVDVHVENFNQEKMAWTMDAEESFYYQSANYVQTTKPQIVIYEKSGQTTTVNSGTGIFFEKTGNILFNTDVLVKTSTGTMVSSDEIRYDSKTHEFISDVPVLVTYPSGTTVHGNAMVADEELKHITFRNRASGKFMNSDLQSKNAKAENETVSEKK